MSTKELNNAPEEEPTQSTCEVLKEEITHLKWRVLAVACFLTFGSYYIFDFPASIGTGTGATIQSRFLAEGKEYNQAMNQALYSVYSYPNTVLAIFGGLLIDKYIGLRKSMILFVSLILAGSAFFYLGVLLTNYPLMMFSRVLFGLGGESLSVAQSAFVARWFRGGRGMALAFGITISFSRVGSSFNFLFSPRIADNFDVQMACLSGVGACVISLVACIILILADVYAVRKGLIKAEAVGGDEKEGESVMKLSDLLKLPLELWLICVICIFCYCSIFPFVGIAKNFFQVKYNLSGTEASDWLSLYSIVSALASPLVGFVVDQTGRHTQWMAAASLSFCAIHLALYSQISYAVAWSMMPFMGLGYALLVSGLWPSVPYAVPSSMVGMAYGVVTAVQNFGLASVPLVTGRVLDAHTAHPARANAGLGDRLLISANNSTPFVLTSPMLPRTEGYELSILLFSCLAFTSFLASFALYLVDTRRCCHSWSTAGYVGRALRATPFHRKGILSSSPTDREAILKRVAAAKSPRRADQSIDLPYASEDDEMGRTLPYLPESIRHAYLSNGREEVIMPAVSFPDWCFGGRLMNACQVQTSRCLKSSSLSGSGGVAFLLRPKILMIVCLIIIAVNGYFLSPTTTPTVIDSGQG